MSFIIYSLPRSRSAWLAHFLNYPFTVPLQPVGHNLAPLCKSVERFVKAYKEEGMCGSVELEGMIGWQVIRKEMPDLKVVVMRRPLQEVYDSLTMLGYIPNLTELASLNAMLDIIASQPGVFSINSSDLDAPIACKWLFEYCLELDFDFDWWCQLTQLNVQVNIDDWRAMEGEMRENMALYKADVLEQMRDIKECLN